VPEVIPVPIKWIVAILQGLSSLFLAWIIKALTDIRSDVKSVNKELRFLNGRMIRQEQWANDHDKQDDRRFQELLTKKRNIHNGE